MRALAKIEAGRFIVTKRYPYFGDYVLALKPQPLERVRTFAIDRRFNLYFNEKMVETMSVEHVASSMLHHVVHLAARHHITGARISRYPQLYAVCACLSVNSYIEDLGLELPPWEHLPERFGLPRRKSAETYYVMLRDRLEERDPVTGELGLNLAQLGEDLDDDLFDAPEDGEGTFFTDLLLDNAAQDLAPHLEGDADSGILPLGATLHARPTKRTRRWESLIKARIGEALEFTAGQGYSSYLVPNLRQSAMPQIRIAGTLQPKAEVAIVLDTSGSMEYQKALQRALGHVDRILRNRRTPSSVTLLSVDADVHATKRLRSMSQLEVKGGGGTDLSTGLFALRALRPRPHVVIVLTDGQTKWPEQAPISAPYIVGQIGKLAQGYDPPPRWAKVVQID